jgi:hypothetical protein
MSYLTALLFLCLSVYFGIVSFDKMLEENDRGPFGNDSLSQWQLIFGVCVVVGLISFAIVVK